MEKNKKAKAGTAEYAGSGQLVLSYRYVHALQQLLDRPMHGQKSKLRNSFIRLAKPIINEYEAERRKLNLKHAKLDPKTKEPMPSKDGKGAYEYKDEGALENEWGKLGQPAGRDRCRQRHKADCDLLA